MRYAIILITVIGLAVFTLSPNGILHWLSVETTSYVLNTPQKPASSFEQEIPITKQFSKTTVEHELTAQFQALAKSYKQTIRFPNYSIPIDSGQIDLLEPFIALSVNLNIDPKAQSTASLLTDEYIFFKGQTIGAKLETMGEFEATDVTISLVENNRPLALFSVQQEGQVFIAKLTDTKKEWVTDLHIRADFIFGHYGRVSILAPIKFSPLNGIVKSVGDTYIEGANLVIPVKLDIHTKGRYRLSANLFDQSKNPIAHLNAKQNLTLGENQWLLNVHSEVLRHAHNSGPYIVGTWQLTKLPERPGIPTSFGQTLLGDVKIDGFNLNDYDNTPWKDPKDLARLDFLEKIANSH